MNKASLQIRAVFYRFLRLIPFQFLSILVMMLSFLFSHQVYSDDYEIPVEIDKMFLDAAFESADSVLRDFKILLEVYFEYKLSSESPHSFPNIDYQLAEEVSYTLPRYKNVNNSPTIRLPGDFYNIFYDEFAKILDAEPRLKGNIYREYMRTYGGSGDTGDVLQRFHSIIVLVHPHLSEIDEKILNRKLWNKYNYPLSGFVMYEAHKIFYEVSKASGYEMQQNVSRQSRLKEFTTLFNQLRQKHTLNSKIKCTSLFTQ
ncbi:MAG: hypothetical protein HOO06_01370 [Bdellovibrionaceae bacterium]|nr:hypothetical protein [Pseudobdellovibrionaceae bacterium]